MSEDKTFYFCDTYIDIYSDLAEVGSVEGNPDYSFFQLAPTSQQEAKEMALAFRKASRVMEKIAASMQSSSIEQV